MTPVSPDPQCADINDDLAGLATGTLTGRRRADVLDHLETCPACAAELDELSAAADALMTLVPEAEPPEQFAERTVALMRDPGGADRDRPAAIRPMPTRRPWATRPAARRVLAAAAVVVALALGVGIGGLVAGSGGSAGGRSADTAGAAGVRTATLQSASGAEGSVVLAPGRPGWLVMAVGDAGAWGTVTCRVTLADGTQRVVGRYPMTSGYGSWAARLPVPASSVRSVALVGSGGATLATARLPDSATG